MNEKTDYDKQLNQGLKISGENKNYFSINRIKDLKSQLPKNFKPQRVLDYGCGVGDSTRFLSDFFPSAKIFGFDSNKKKISCANKSYASSLISFHGPGELDEINDFDLCYVNGVFHHISPPKRKDVINFIFTKLAYGGYFALFENNPWNPGTRLVMKMIPFDKDAKPLTVFQCQHLVLEGGFSLYSPPRYLFYFPRFLSCLRFFERRLIRFPLGAQYYILTIKK